jgi:hypothetical protein
MNEQAGTTDRGVGDRGGDVEDAVTAGEGGVEGVAVEDVGAAQGEALLGALQSQQVRVLAVRCTSARGRKAQVSTASSLKDNAMQEMM